MPSSNQQFRFQARAAYDAAADTYADAFRSTEPEQPGELAEIDRFLTELPGAEVLDAGCGAGRLLPYLAERGGRPVGIDLSPEMIRRAQADHPEFPTQTGALEDLPWPAETFHGVFSWYSTIHSPDTSLAQILHEFARVLVPGGRALIAFQAGTGGREVGSAFRERGHEVQLHRFHRSLDVMAEAARGPGFVETHRWSRPPQGSEREEQAVLVVQKG